MIDPNIARLTRNKSYMNGWTKGNKVYMVFKGSDGKDHTQLFEPDWYFFVRTRDIQAHQDYFASLKSSGLIQHIKPWFMNKQYSQVFCENLNLRNYQIKEGATDARTILDKMLRMKGITTYETDVDSLKRIMNDYEIQISDRYRVINFDIETQDALETGERLPISIGEYPIVSFSVELNNGKTYFVTHTSEEYILEQIVKFFDATDIATTWNGNRFDIPYVKDRLRIYGQHYNFKRLLHVDYFEQIYSLHRFDTKWEQFNLDYVTKKVCPDAPKFDRGNRTIYSMYQEYLNGENEDLRLYNNSDVVALRRINEEEKVLPFMIQVCQSTGSFLSQFHKSWLIDSFIMRQGHNEGTPLVSKDPTKIKVGKYDGAYVYEPIVGRYENVAVYDFNSLYPNIIKTWNIGTPDDTMRGPDQIDKETWGDTYSRGATPNDEVYYLQENPSILAKAVSMFLDQRAAVRAEQKKHEKKSKQWESLELQQLTWKILANSLYGILGSDKTRYYDVRLAESITHGGRIVFHIAADYFNSIGKPFFYGDTDSNFVANSDADPSSILPGLHEYLDKELKTKWGCKNPTIRMGFEKRYRKLIICHKKHYYGLLEEPDENGNPEFNGRGMEHRKRKTCTFARKQLKKLFEHLLLHDEGPEFYARWIKKLKNKVLNDPISYEDVEHFVIQQAIKKPPSEYKKKTPDIHVQVYQDLKASGKEVWLPYVVRYVPVIPDGKRAGNEDACAYELLKNSGRTLDRKKIWDVNIYQKMMVILNVVFPDYDWEKFHCGKMEKRKSLAKRLMNSLKNAKTVTTWIKSYYNIVSAKLPESMRERLLSTIKPAVLEEKKAEIRVWVRKRLTKYMDKEELRKVCNRCDQETDHVQGMRYTPKNGYNSTLCLECGLEDSIRLGE